MPLKHIGFSGTRNGLFLDRQMRLMRTLHDELERDAVFHHGCCVGADVEAAYVAHNLGYRIVAHPPIKTDCLAPIEQWCADEVRPPKSYFARNRDIVDETIMLIAAPPTLDRTVGGGTWFTIDYAAKRGKPVTIIEP